MAGQEETGLFGIPCRLWAIEAVRLIHKLCQACGSWHSGFFPLMTIYSQPLRRCSVALGWSVSDEAEERHLALGKLQKLPETSLMPNSRDFPERGLNCSSFRPEL